MTISGSFSFNTINAIMGPSGSGKTTLMKSLNTSNKYVLSPESKIFVNNCVKIVSCFVYQNQSERLMCGLTVKQSLLYSSQLKNSYEKGFIDHKRIVDEIMSDLMIDDISGNRMDSCSGGQLKRISIGLELTSVNKPNILFIDEPTTGLDSNAAEIVSYLKVLNIIFS